MLGHVLVESFTPLDKFRPVQREWALARERKFDEVPIVLNAALGQRARQHQQLRLRIVLEVSQQALGAGCFAVAVLMRLVENDEVRHVPLEQVFVLQRLKRLVRQHAQVGVQSPVRPVERDVCGFGLVFERRWHKQHGALGLHSDGGEQADQCLARPHALHPEGPSEVIQVREHFGLILSQGHRTRGCLEVLRQLCDVDGRRESTRQSLDASKLLTSDHACRKGLRRRGKRVFIHGCLAGPLRFSACKSSIRSHIAFRACEG